MRRVAVSLAILACAGSAATPVAAACWEAEEYEAARMRDLQTVLMVSALKCGRADADMPLAYNKWVGRAKAKLLAGEQKLLAHFVRGGDQSKYDKFTTALAVRSAARGRRGRTGGGNRDGSSGTAASGGRSSAGPGRCCPGGSASRRSVYTSRDCFSAASMKLANSGCGSNGLDLSSGWNCTPTNQG